MSIHRKATRAREMERRQLHNEVFHLRCSLDELYDRFDMLTDQTQVDACIFELNAVMAKYDYALKCLKTFDVS